MPEARSVGVSGVAVEPLCVHALACDQAGAVHGGLREVVAEGAVGLADATGRGLQAGGVDVEYATQGAQAGLAEGVAAVRWVGVQAPEQEAGSLADDVSGFELPIVGAGQGGLTAARDRGHDALGIELGAAEEFGFAFVRECRCHSRRSSCRW